MGTFNEEDIQKTTKFSLVQSPELGKLGELVTSGRLHVYVEGLDDLSYTVKFHDLYREFEETNFESEESPLSSPFDVDMNDELRPFLEKEEIEPVDFLLYIYSSNDIELRKRGEHAKKPTSKEIIYFTDTEDSTQAFTLKSPPNDRKKLEIYETTECELNICYRSFSNAISRIERQNFPLVGRFYSL